MKDKKYNDPMKKGGRGLADEAAVLALSFGKKDSSASMRSMSPADKEEDEESSDEEDMDLGLEAKKEAAARVAKALKIDADAIDLGDLVEALDDYYNACSVE